MIMLLFVCFAPVYMMHRPLSTWHVCGLVAHGKSDKEKKGGWDISFVRVRVCGVECDVLIGVALFA